MDVTNKCKTAKGLSTRFVSSQSRLLLPTAHTLCIQVRVYDEATKTKISEMSGGCDPPPFVTTCISGMGGSNPNP